MAGRTTFIVAHRLSALRRADFVVVLDGGRVVQQGSREELMRVDGPYRRAAEAQFAESQLA
jgi:ATP-binding cassette subfamily B protein